MIRQRIAQGSVWRADFEAGGIRPAIVASRNELNNGQFILVIPCFTSETRKKAAFPNNLLLNAGDGGLPQESVAMTHLIGPIEADRLLLEYGKLDDESLTNVLHALAWTVDLFSHA